MGSTWHPECFCCEMCNKELADLGFIKNQGRALCHECNAKVGMNQEMSLELHSSLFAGQGSCPGKIHVSEVSRPHRG